MFCKYKTFCIAPNQNTIADLLLLEGTDIAMNFGIRIVMGPVIEVSLLLFILLFVSFLFLLLEVSMIVNSTRG